MIKKLNFVLFVVLAMFLVVSCTTKPPAAKSDVAASVDTGETSVDAVSKDISEANSADEELDTSELDDVDSIIADIEKI